MTAIRAVHCCMSHLKLQHVENTYQSTLERLFFTFNILEDYV